MKTIVLLALGLVGSDARKHKKHHQALNKQVLQAEIEQLREAYNNLEERYEELEHFADANRMGHSLVQAQGPAPYGVAGAMGKGPAYPSPQPFVRGEKQWMDNGQNINDWGDHQVDVANSRIPYFSTVQTESESGAAPNKYGQPVDKKGKSILGAPAYPSPQPFIRGEKQWMDNA